MREKLFTDIMLKMTAMAMIIGLMMMLVMMMAMITTIGDATNVLENALTQLRSASGAPVCLFDSRRNLMQSTSCDGDDDYE